LFVRLAGALEVADELLARRTAPGTYRPWHQGNGKRARDKWRGTNGDPFEDVREYRNRLVHGRVVPAFERRRELWFPRRDRVNRYVDWRKITGDAWRDHASDFEQADKIVHFLWDQLVDYLESNWRAHLV
jgi:hypothetical protein